MIHDMIHESSKLDLPNPQAVMGSHGDNVGVLAAQADLNEAVNKAVDAQLEAESALERAA